MFGVKQVLIKDNKTRDSQEVMHSMLAGRSFFKRTNSVVCMSNNEIMALQEKKVMQAKETKTSSAEVTVCEFSDRSPDYIQSICKTVTTTDLNYH